MELKTQTNSSQEVEARGLELVLKHLSDFPKQSLLEDQRKQRN